MNSNEKRNHLRRKCLLDIYLFRSYLRHNGRAMELKNGGGEWEPGWIYMIMPKRLLVCQLKNFSLHAHPSS